MGDKVIGLDDVFLEVGGSRITGFASTAISIPSPESMVTDKEGLDSVASIAKHSGSLVLPTEVTLLADSPSVKVLKGIEKTKAIVPYRFEWEELGIYVEALEARVEEIGGLEISTEMPELKFKITLKNFVEIKGL